MALVEQLGDDSECVVCLACCHMALVFAIMHLYDIIFFLLKKLKRRRKKVVKSGIDNWTEWSMIPACQPYVLF